MSFWSNFRLVGATCYWQSHWDRGPNALPTEARPPHMKKSLFRPAISTAHNFACNSLEALSDRGIRSLIFCGFQPYTQSHHRGIACEFSGMTLGAAPSTTARYLPLPPTSTARTAPIAIHKPLSQPRISRQPPTTPTAAAQRVGHAFWIGSDVLDRNCSSG